MGQPSKRKGDRIPIFFDVLELKVRTIALATAAKVVEGMLNADTSDHRGAARACSCGGIAHYRGRRAKTFMTVIGAITLHRAYYYCPDCKKGSFPRDDELGLQEYLSPGLQRMLALTAATVSFQETEDLLKELAGVTVTAKHAERTAESIGNDIAEDERSTTQTQAPSSDTMYVGLDGTGIPMRAEELIGRVGKQADGSSKTREVKLVTVWTADGRDKDGIPERDEGSISYNAAIESAAMANTDEQLSDFARRVQRETERRGFDIAKRQVIIGDGAKWIWNIADELFPDAIQIVDLYHAKGTVSETAKNIFGPTSVIGQQKAKQWRDLLEQGNIDQIINDLSAFSSCQDASTCIKYLQTNRNRMQYPLFRTQGLCTSSGVVEAGCKTAVGARLKQAGMHWSVNGSNAIIALRCYKLSNRFDDYWNRRRLLYA